MNISVENFFTKRYVLVNTKFELEKTIMSKVFIEDIRKGLIKQPTKRGFKISTWDKEWAKVVEKNDKCEEIYIAGKIIFTILEEIRNKLNSIYLNRPKISNEKKLMTYIALSNRDRSILGKSDFQESKETFDYFSTTMTANRMNNEITLSEIADGCVDGLQKAIFFSITNNGKKSKPQTSNDKISVLNFITKESYLSQIYSLCEGLWSSLLWGGYSFKEVAENVFEIKQSNSNIEVGYEISQIRRSRIAAQLSQIAVTPNIVRNFNSDNYIAPKKEGRKKKLKSINISSAREIIRTINAGFRISELYLEDEFPKELLELNTSLGFSIKKTINVFRCLVLLSHHCEDLFPTNDGFKNVSKIIEFCPRFNKIEMARSITKATGYSFIETSRILEFLEFNGSMTKDLWCYPLVTIGNDYAILTSSLLTPSITRLVEHWFIELDISLQDKGLVYEKTIVRELNSAIVNNPIITDYNEGISKRLKLNNGEEEIDLLIRIGDIILLGEAKSIVTTDSPISQYRTTQTLKKAAKQVNRKIEFVNNNLQEIFDKIGWIFNKDIEYKIEGCILNSSRMFSGFSIDNVPVCDKEILCKYFANETIPFLSNFNKDDNEPVHLAWHVLYKDFAELQTNLGKYLKHPPQIHASSTDFKYKPIYLPAVSVNSMKLIYLRMIPSNKPIHERLNKSSIFPIKTIDNFDNLIKNIDAII